MRKITGLTLIELMISILIIGLISTIGLVALKDARAKAHDSRRIFDVNQYAQALRIYAQENPDGTFPSESGFLGANHPADVVNDQLKKYIPELPSDPLDRGGTETANFYYYYVAENTCPGGIFPTVHVQTIETNNPNFKKNPAADCSNQGGANSADYLIILH